MRLHTLRLASGDEFLKCCREMEGVGGLCVPTRARFQPGEPLVLEVWFPPMKTTALLRATADRQDQAQGTLLARLAPGERSTLDFVLGIAAATASPPRRRRYNRFPVEVPTTWQIRGVELNHAGKIVDVSRGGVYIHTDVPPPTGTELKLTLTFGENVRPLQLYGRVARVHRGRRSGGMGVRLRYRTTLPMRRLRRLIRRMDGMGELLTAEVRPRLTVQLQP